MNAMSAARDKVEPLLGRIQPMDSAEAVFKLALDHAKVDTAKVHPSAYEALVDMLLDRQEEPVGANLGMDSKSADAYAKKFNPSRLRRY